MLFGLAPHWIANTTASARSNDGNLGAYIGQLSTPTDQVYIYNVGSGGMSYDLNSTHIHIYQDYSCAPSGSMNLVYTPGINAVSGKLSSGAIFCQNAS